MNDTMAGGWRALDEHDRLRDEIAEIIACGRARASPDTPTPDVPIRLVIGAVRSLLPSVAPRERELAGVADELVTGWSATSADLRAPLAHAGPRPGTATFTARIANSPAPPARDPTGALKALQGQIPTTERPERIVYATAEVAARKGYTVTRVADITSAAGVDRRVFYTHFADKQQAFLAVHELCVQQLLAVTASAFFSVNAWPERAWEAMRAYTHFQ